MDAEQDSGVRAVVNGAVKVVRQHGRDQPSGDRGAGSQPLVLADNIPQAHEVTRVLEKMAEIAADDEASTPVMDWEKSEQLLHITDPFFAFYLKWGASSA